LHDDPFDFDRPCDPPVEEVWVEPKADARVPAAFRDSIAIYTVHDGGAIPEQFRLRPDGSPVVDPVLLRAKYVDERDWGANLVAEQLAAALGVGRYSRIRLARVVLDFNRFPGSTPAGETNALERLAIGPLYAEALSHGQKMALLEGYYDRISDLLETSLGDKLLSIAVHTYDELHGSATKRADLSMVTLPLSYQREARMTFGVFDRMYPDRLAESTCSRILRDRISLGLERAGFRVVHNHPYAMPDGSTEVRAQVWYFFRYLRRCFQAEHPKTVGDPAYEWVWLMLLDTNLRLAEAEALRSFLHRFRKVPAEQLEDFREALDAYRHVRDFLRESTVVFDFKHSRDRPSSLGVEVRKDLLCSLDRETGAPMKPTERQKEVAGKISDAIARAIAIYLAEDRGVDEA
jgi:hypothetical protein